MNPDKNFSTGTISRRSIAELLGVGADDLRLTDEFCDDFADEYGQQTNVDYADLEKDNEDWLDEFRLRLAEPKDGDVLDPCDLGSRADTEDLL